MADGFFTCGVTPIGVSGPVFTQVDLMNERVNQTLDATLNLAEELASTHVSSFSFTVDPSQVLTYAIREVENEDVEFRRVEFDELGELPTIGAANAPGPGAPPALPDAPPDAPPVDIPPDVSVYHPSFGITPTPIFGTVPEYGDLTGGIPFPTPRPITLPTPPTVDFGIAFTGVRPVFAGTTPDAADFNYTEQAYSPLLVNEIKTAIQSMLAGTTGLPRVVEDALWARQAEREAEAAAAATQDAFDEMSSRGFTLPNGPLQKKLAKVRQNTQNQSNALGRDVMIRVHEVLVDQYKFGVQQGIALENTWIQLYSDIQNRRLQAAQVAVNIAISVYNALVAQYQAAAGVYEVEARVHATLLQAELAKLQAYAEELRAQQLIGELNAQDVELYKARLAAIETNVRVYLADIQAYSEIAGTEKLKLDAFRTTIDIEQGKLAASQQELSLWTGKLQGQGLVQQAYQTRVQAYLGNVQARSVAYQSEIERQRGEIAALEADTNRFRARVDGVLARANFNVAKGQVIVSDNASKVQKYLADSQWVGSYNEALAQKIRMLNDANAQNTSLALKNGEINAQNGLAAQQTMEQAVSTATQVLAQMTSSFASSVNMNASVADSTQFSQSCNYSTGQSF